MSGNKRRAEIIRILRGTRLISVSCLADMLNVSASTIKRDILSLTVDDGYPIDTVMGKKGGIVLLCKKNYRKTPDSKNQRKKFCS